MATSKSPSGYKTTILPKFVGDIGRFRDPSTLETWELPTNPTSPTLENINLAASHLLTTDIPVAFPTETVYGLGADATRSSAVKGIYTTKGRPSDNPLIIHVCDLTMLRSLLDRPIPDIYIPLIKKFWPGPLTILLPNPPGSKLAPEVTAGNSTFGARMPNTPLALSLIKAAGVPLAAPSANASTKPSPTTAQHVLQDLDGKIEFILDGGSCQVGLESTFVDGLASPPRILRPGGVSIDLIREVEGFEGVEKSYLDASEEGSKAPLAPGMKYKHYSPKAKVVLYEFFSRHLKFPDGSEADLVRCGIADEALKIIKSIDGKGSYLDYAEISKERVPKIGVVTTKHWVEGAGLGCTVFTTHTQKNPTKQDLGFETPQLKHQWLNSLAETQGCNQMKPSTIGFANTHSIYDDELKISSHELWEVGNPGREKIRHVADVIEIRLGQDTKDIAHGLFSALRDLDQRGVDVIYVDGIDDAGKDGDIAAAVMNRLRKAASIIIDDSVPLDESKVLGL